MTPSVHALILNYKRPGNIGRIVRACLNCPDIAAIHVVDQASPSEQLQSLPAAKRVIYSRLPNLGSGRRLLYGCAIASDLVIAIDDDVFLTPLQITELLKRAIKYPARANGIWGQIIVDSDAQVSIAGGIRNGDWKVDILNRVYVFSPRQARRALDLAKLIGLDINALGPIDDILLSFATPGRPLCHEIGPIEECPTSNEAGTALWKQPGFEDVRLDAVAKLRAIGRG